MNRSGDCVFCNIIDKKEPAYIVYEDNTTLAFLDHLPLNEGHILVVPKVHVKDFIEANMQVRIDVMRTTKLIADILYKTHQFDANIVTSKGEKAGQDVWHLHAHLIPRTRDRIGIELRTIIDTKAKEILPEIAAHLRKVLVCLPDNKVVL